MFIRKFLLIGSVLLLFLPYVEARGQNREDYWPHSLGCLIEVTDSILKPGRVNMLMDIRSRYQWDTVTLEFITYGGLVYEGERKQTMVINKWDLLKIPFEVIIPDNDTSGIRIEFFKNGNPVSAAVRFFTTTDDTVRLFLAKPQPPHKGSRRSVGIPDSLYVDGVAPLRFQLDLHSMHRSTGEANLILRIWSLLDWGETTIRLVFAERLQYSGPTEWQISLSRGDSLKYDIPVVIPPDDTTGIQFQLITEDETKLAATKYFVTTGEDLEVYRSKPRPGRQRPRPEGSPWVPPPGFIPDTVL